MEFTSTLRNLTTASTKKTTYISAAPQCYYPSPSLPLDVLQLVDFVFVQFYDSSSCNIGSTGFNSSITGWSERLSGPSLYLGGPSFSAVATSGGYQDPDTFAQTIAGVKAMKLSNFGGVMLWDGAYGLATTDSKGEDYIDVTKTALEA